MTCEPRLEVEGGAHYDEIVNTNGKLREGHSVRRWTGVVTEESPFPKMSKGMRCAYTRKKWKLLSPPNRSRIVAFVSMPNKQVCREVGVRRRARGARAFTGFTDSLAAAAAVRSVFPRSPRVCVALLQAVLQRSFFSSAIDRLNSATKT